MINPPQGEWIDEDQVKAFISQAGLSSWKQGSTDGIELRGALYGLMDEISGDLESAKQEPLVVPIDQHFNVKGIGLVAIGYVQSGSVSVHDELHLLPAEGPGTVKSLQVMDDDVDTAVAGDRVGIALRNTKEEHLTGGSLVTHPALEDKNKGISIPLCLEKHEKSSIGLSVSPFQKESSQSVMSCTPAWIYSSLSEELNPSIQDSKLHGIHHYLSERKPACRNPCSTRFQT